MPEHYCEGPFANAGQSNVDIRSMKRWHTSQRATAPSRSSLLMSCQVVGLRHKRLTIFGQVSCSGMSHLSWLEARYCHQSQGHALQGPLLSSASLPGTSVPSRISAILCSSLWPSISFLFFLAKQNRLCCWCRTDCIS